jgi:acyl-CoA-binding protein
LLRYPGLVVWVLRGACWFQATEGDVRGDRPSIIRLEARAKYDAWAKHKGMSKEEAMQGYIDLLGDPEVWENHELLKTKYLEEKAAA